MWHMCILFWFCVDRLSQYAEASSMFLLSSRRQLSLRSAPLSPYVMHFRSAGICRQRLRCIKLPPPPLPQPAPASLHSRHSPRPKLHSYPHTALTKNAHPRPGPADWINSTINSSKQHQQMELEYHYPTKDNIFPFLFSFLKHCITFCLRTVILYLFINIFYFPSYHVIFPLRVHYWFCLNSTLFLWPFFSMTLYLLKISFTFYWSTSSISFYFHLICLSISYSSQAFLWILHIVQVKSCH